MSLGRDTAMSIVSEIGVGLPGAESGRVGGVTREERARPSRVTDFGDRKRKDDAKEKRKKEEYEAVCREPDQPSSRETDERNERQRDKPRSEEAKEGETPTSQRRHGGLRLRDESALDAFGRDEGRVVRWGSLLGDDRRRGREGGRGD